MSVFIKNLYERGFLQIKKQEDKNIYHVQTPCRFVIKAPVVNDLKKKYLADEEIGGILWAKPQVIEKEKVFVIEQVDYIRNDIEDEPYYDKDGKLRTRKDTYRPDKHKHAELMKKIFAADQLPVKFHTHPTKGTHFLQAITIQQLQTDTSEQDRLESEQTHNVEGLNLLMPRALIVGNGEITSNIFVGLYNGFIAPAEFEKAKKAVQEENMERISNGFSNATFTDGEKIVLGIGAILLAAAIIKYPKYSLPVIATLGAIALVSLDNTAAIEKPSYFNKLAFGDANIYLP